MGTHTHAQILMSAPNLNVSYLSSYISTVPSPSLLTGHNDANLFSLSLTEQLIYPNNNNNNRKKKNKQKHTTHMAGYTPFNGS